MNRENNKPTHYVRYKVSGTKDDYRQIGAAWLKEDGNMSIRLDGLPLGDWDGALFLNSPKGQRQEASR